MLWLWLWLWIIWAMYDAVCCLCFHNPTFQPNPRCWLLSVVPTLLVVICCLLSVVCCLLSVVCCLLSVVCCLLSVVCCLLSVVCCLLSVVCCCNFGWHLCRNRVNSVISSEPTTP